MKIDLHMHTTASDGEKTPEEIVDWAIEKGLKRIAITDHEVTGGCSRAIEYAKDKGIEIVPGIEIGANIEEFEAYDIHIVGLFLDLENERLQELSGKLMEARKVQKQEIISVLNDLGYDISFEELVAEVEGENYGRPHIAKILMRKYDEFGSVGQVFDELLGSGGKVDVVQWKDNVRNTIDIIHESGGIAVLAHPMLYGSSRFGQDIEKIVEYFVGCGGDGIEVDYLYENRISGDVNNNLVEKAREFSSKHGLVVSGGGDFHREGEDFEIGDFGVSEEEFLELKECWENRKEI